MTEMSARGGLRAVSGACGALAVERRAVFQASEAITQIGAALVGAGRRELV